MENNFDSLIKKLHEAQNLNNEKKIQDAQIALSKYYFSIQNFSKSKKILLDLKKENKNIFGINYALGLIELENNNINFAINYFQKELKINPEHFQAQDLLNKLNVYSNFPYVTLILTFICVFSFFLFFSNSMDYFLTFSLSNYNYSFFSILTSIFFHSSLFHLLINVIILVMFGLILEKYLGSFIFLIIFLFGGFFGNLFQFIFSSSNVFILGASGGIFAIFGALLMRNPLLNLRIFGIIKTPLILVLGIIISLSFFISNFLIKNNIHSGDISHLIGFLFGVLIVGILNLESISNFYSWIFISIGFYLLFDVAFNFYFFQNFLILFIEFIKLALGFFLILYFYFNLKNKIIQVGDENE